MGVKHLEIGWEQNTCWARRYEDYRSLTPWNGNGRQFMREIADGTGTRADEMLGRPVSHCAALCHCVAKGYEAYMRQIDNGSAPSLAL